MGAVIRSRVPTSPPAAPWTYTQLAYGVRISDAAGEVATLTTGAKTVTLRGPWRTFTEGFRPFSDDFARTVADGFNSAPAGGKYSITGGADADYSVSTGKGRILLATANVARYATIVNVLSRVDVACQFTTDIIPTGAAASGSLIFGYQDSSNHYRARLTFNTTGTVTLAIARFLASSATDIAASTTVGTGYVAGDIWNVRVVWDGATGEIDAYAWKEGDAVPGTPTREATDASFTSGRVGFRGIANTGATNTPVLIIDNLTVASGAWPTANVPVITHNTWVRVLDQPFGGLVTEDIAAQITAWLTDTSPDLLQCAMEYITGAPVVTGTVLGVGGRQISGTADYGPLDAAGDRVEGGDFNDYMQVTYTYPASGGGTTDVPEASEAQCLDCSGLTRMIWGWRQGIPMTRGVEAFFDGINLPRESRYMATDGPGIIVVEAVGTPPALTDLRIGDVLFWDATAGSDESSGQLDHVGPYLGTDTTGKKRFISSRKTPSGPTFADLGAQSCIGEVSGLYSTQLRLIRRF